ncbi:MAG: IPT/TIG domain-containing protein [Deltaproteobacteria bacterium]|nr:IPT/TIG domain-containing protein [Deltaproteobacteria bacterium]
MTVHLALRTSALAAILLAFAAPPSAEAQAKKKRAAPKSADAKWKVRKPPKLTSFAPTQGLPKTSVTIMGKNFDSATKVRFNGKTLKVLAVTATTLKVRLPGDAVTDRFVLSKPGFPDHSADNAFNVVRRPKISGFTPPRGDIGVSVTIRGQHFLPTDKVLLAGKAMAVTRARATMITAKVPSDAHSGRLAIQRDKKVVATTKRSFQVALPPPVITSFKPTSGSPGTLLTVTGRNFDTRDSLFLAGKKLKIRSRTATTMVAQVAKNRTGKISVRGSAGRRTESSAAFTVVRPQKVKSFQPAFGPPGTRVRIFGAHFISGDQVYLGDRALTLRTLAPTQIVAEVPAGVQSGRLSVRRGTRKTFARGKFLVQYPPTLVTIKPMGGPPGTIIAIEGTGFTKGTSVLLAGVRLKMKKKKLPAHLWVQLPKNARTGRLVVVTSAGSTQSKKNLHVVQYAAPTSFLPKRASYGAILRIQGKRFHKGIAVYVGKTPLTTTRVTPTQIWAKIPEGAKTGKVSVESFGKRITLKAKIEIVAPAPLLAFTVAPRNARRGSEVTLTLTPPSQGVSVYLDGRPLPHKVLAGGKQIVVTIPADAKSSYLEVEYKGRRYKAKKKLRVH